MAADPHARARTQVLGAALCFGTTGTAQELLRPDGASTLSVGAARIILGSALLAVFATRVSSSAGPVRQNSTQGWWRVVVPGGIGVAIYQLAFFAAVDRTGVAVGTVVAIGSGPAIAGALGRLLNGEPLTGRWAAATALAVAGVAVLAAASGGDAALDPGGIGLAVLAGAGYATYTVLAKRLLVAGHAPERVMAATFGTGAVLLVPVLFGTGAGWLGDAGGLGLAIYLGVVPTAIAYALFARGLRLLSAGETATLTLAEPLTATVLGAAALGEDPGAAGFGGGALVLAGLLVLALPRLGAHAAADRL